MLIRKMVCLIGWAALRDEPTFDRRSERRRSVDEEGFRTHLYLLVSDVS